jgi:predicted Zn-dependent protease
LMSKEFLDSLAQCSKLAQAGDVSQAIAKCSALVREAPEFGHGHHALGVLLWRARQYESALKSMHAAIHRPNPIIDYFADLRFALTATRQLQAALRVARRAATLWPESTEARIMLAQSLAQCFQADEMHAIFRALIAAEPDNIIYWESYARAAEMVGATSDVLTMCERILRRDPGKILTFGVLYFRALKAVGRAADSARYRDALIDHYMKAPETKLKAIGFVDAYISASAAEVHWRAYAAENPSDPLALYSMANNLASQGKWDAAERMLEAAQALKLDEGVQANLTTLARSIQQYIPALKAAVCQPLAPRIPIKRNMIVIRGVLEKQFVDVIKHYRVLHGDHFIILSTWSTSDPDLLAEIQPYIDDLVLNALPQIPGMGNLNYQIQCAASGVARAKELGAEYLLLTRTDVAFMKPNLMAEFIQAMANDKPDPHQTPGLRHRLVVCEYWSFLEPLYHLSDLFCYGHVDDVAQYWALEHMSDACLTPEITLTRAFARKVGRILENDVADVVAAAHDLFHMREASSLQLFWLKYPAASNSPHYHHRTIILPEMLTSGSRSVV